MICPYEQEQHYNISIQKKQQQLLKTYSTTHGTCVLLRASTNLKENSRVVFEYSRNARVGRHIKDAE